MSIDMSQFYQVFFEESAEHLANMESLLLGLDMSAPDPDQLNAIFRAAHSIKGGSGTFGFTDMTELTHVLETLLDRIRKNEIAITSEMVDAFLQTSDVLRSLLEAHRDGTDADLSAAHRVRARLEALAGKEQPTESGRVALHGGTTSPPVKQQLYRIRFPNSSTIFPSTDHLNNLLEDLANIGKISDQAMASGSVSLALATHATEAELRDIFSFFLDPGQLEISLHEDIGQAGDRVPAHADTADPGYGFFIEPEQVKAAVENAQGYGFFVDLEKHAEAPATEGNIPAAEIPQRRASDKVGAAGETSIRVSVEKVDQLINLVGELVITQSMLADVASKMDPVLHDRLVKGLAQLERNTRDLQESVMSVRMMPINFVFSRFPRVVHDLAQKLGKKVQLKMVGEGTELDKGLIEKISDPLTHLVRNSLDHGIEMPEERIARNKDPQGTITLRAAHQGGNIVIQVADDGAGMNRERILAKAREKGIHVSDNISDAEVWQMTFAPGFSTATVVTDVSGRGVGMDVVKRNIEGIGGRVEIASQAGEGSVITIRLPLTLAILDGLSIAVGEQIYIIPLSFISESLQPAADNIKSISGQGQVVYVRGEYLPLLALHRLFNIKPRFTEPEQGILVLLEAEGRKVALFVDELVGEHQVVIKSLETNYRKVPGVSGATIMGDGRVAIIIDAAALIKLA